MDVCPVDCIYTKDGEDDMYYIHPEECIDCAACEPVCPVVAIFAEDDTPQEWESYKDLNYGYFGVARWNILWTVLAIRVIGELDISN